MITEKQRKEIIKLFIDKRNHMDYPLWKDLGLEDKIELLAGVVEALFENKSK